MMHTDSSLRIRIRQIALFMHHFDIVLTLAKLALDADSGRATQQIERLREVLDEEPEGREQAATLSRLLNPPVGVSRWHRYPLKKCGSRRMPSGDRCPASQ